MGFIVSWPGVITSDRVSDALVDFTDVFPTLTDVADVTTPAGLDGVSLLPVFEGRDADRHCWYQRNGVRETASQHTRDERYKLYGTGAFYDTLIDPDESTDLAAGGVPAALRAVHAGLLAVLERQIEITRIADPIQQVRRNTLGTGH
ncbi:MAG: sulfatase/phosphatase domain-containing protein [Opitutaceae bacterium]